MPSVHLRWIYESHVAPLEPGEQVHHACFNPWCAEPTHLEALTFKAHRERHKYRGLPLGFNETAFVLG